LRRAGDWSLCKGVSALDGLKKYAGPQVSVETPVAVPAPVGKASSGKGSYGFEPVADAESFGGNRGHNTYYGLNDHHENTGNRGQGILPAHAPRRIVYPGGWGKSWLPQALCRCR